MKTFGPNLYNFCRSRPPICLFVLSILVFIATTVSLAFHVKSSVVMDSEVLSWHKLLTQMSELQLCLSNNTTDNMKRNEHTNTSTLAHLEEALIFNRSAKLPPGYRRTSLKNVPVDAFLFPHKTKRWVSRVPLSVLEFHQEGDAELIVALQHESLTTVCVAVVGDGKLLENFKVDGKVSTDTCGRVPSVSGSMLVHSSSHVPPSWCSEGKRTSADLGLGLQGIQIPLSQEERNSISSHLFFTSGLLVIFLILLLCFAGFRGAKGTRTKTSKLSSDSRGDMQLLPVSQDEEE